MKKIIYIFLVIFFFYFLFLLTNNQRVFAGCGVLCRGNYCNSFAFYTYNGSLLGRGVRRWCTRPAPTCSPVPCKGCTPSTPTGYTATDNDCSITTTNTCTGNNGCGKSCTVSKKFWFIETNVSEPLPSSLSMIVDGQSYTLSSNSTSPATVKYPSTQNNVKTSLPSRLVPSTASGLGYAFKANNYGINNEWLPFDCARGEDYCVESTNNIQNFTPSSYTVLDTLKQGAEGKVSGMYYTVNRCDSGKLYSLPIETYYKVDNIPEPVDVCEWNPALLASDPECEDPGTGDDEEECSMEPDLECTKKEFFTNIGDQDSTSSKGCYSEDYTGIEINNPLKIRVGGVDKDGVDEIKGAVVWFSKSNNTPTLPLITETYSSTSTDDLGILILQDGTDWNNPKIYGINSDNTWGRITDGELINSDGQQIASISDVKVTKGEEVVTFEIILELLTNNTDMLSGTYNFKSIVLDSYMLLSDGRVDISHMIRHFNWGIDLVAPSMTDFGQNVKGPQTLDLYWSVDGTGTRITDAIINGYRDGELINDTISLIEPSGYEEISLDGIPKEDQIGILGEENSWEFLGNVLSNDIYNKTQPLEPYNNSIEVSIGENEGGSIIMYLTAYDQACNNSLREHNIDLRPWIGTKGGIVYSEGSLGSSAKDLTVDQENALTNVLKRVLGSELDTGTELVSSRNDYINNLIHPELGAVRAINTYDSNDRKMYWFEYFKKKLETQKGILTEFEITEGLTKVSQECDSQNCYMYSEENITIPSGYICDRNTLFMSEKNIIINPDITKSEGEGIQGCIFMAKGNIEVNEGEYKSVGAIVEYDYIDGFLMSESQIHIKGSDQLKAIRDGLEIYGGLVSFGSGDIYTSAVNIERNLRLYNYSNPTVVLSWDVRYAKLSEIFFGSEASLYKQEVGFKVF